MKISELIEKLQNTQAKHGDIEVAIQYKIDDQEYSMPNAVFYMDYLKNVEVIYGDITVHKKLDKAFIMQVTE